MANQGMGKTKLTGACRFVVQTGHLTYRRMRLSQADHISFCQVLHPKSIGSGTKPWFRCKSNNGIAFHAQISDPHVVAANVFHPEADRE